MLALVVALAAAGVIVIVSQPAASRLSSDFTINYSAGLLIRQGQLTAPYQQAELGDMMRRGGAGGAGDPPPPPTLPLAARGAAAPPPPLPPGRARPLFPP